MSTPDVFVPDPTNTFNDTVWSTVDTAPTFVITALKNPPLVDSFNCNDNDHISIGDSITLSFPRGGCMTTTSPSTTIKTNAKIRTEITILRTKGDILTHSIPTASNGALLEFGMYLKIKMYNRGNEVYWNPSSPFIQVKVKDNNPLINTALKFFYYGIASPGKDSSWITSSSVLNSPGVVGIYNDQPIPGYPKRTGYLLMTNRIGWMGAAYFLDSTVQKTRLNVFLPLNYTNKNTIVYAVFDKKRTVVRLKSNPAGKSYYAPSVPLNTSVTLVSITKNNASYYLGVKQFTAISGAPITLTPATIARTKAEIDAFLNSL